MTAILVAGIPRSGTTWVARALGETDHAYVLNEPDNHVNDPFAVRAKRALGRYPLVRIEDVSPPEYQRLWERSLMETHSTALPARITRLVRLRMAKRVLRSMPLSQIRAAFPAWDPRLPVRLRLVGVLGLPRARPPWARHVIVKSVFAPLALEWIYERWQPRMAIVLRHPLDVIASWVELGYEESRLYEHPAVLERYLDPFGIVPPASSASLLSRVAWEVGFLTSALERVADQHPDWSVVVHETLCEDPIEQFRSLYEDLELEWGPAAEAFLRDSNRSGAGYETNRVASEQARRWRKRLSHEQVREICAILKGFPLRRWMFSQADSGA